MSVKVQKAKVLAFAVEMSDDLFDGIDGGMTLGRRINVAPVEVYPVSVHSIVSSSHSVGVENREEVKDKLVPEQSGLLAVFGKLTDDSGHHVGRRHLSGMDSCPYNEAFFFRCKLFGLIVIGEQILVLKLLIFIENMLF
jgi:hypothetical protein